MPLLFAKGSPVKPGMTVEMAGDDGGDGRSGVRSPVGAGDDGKRTGHDENRSSWPA